MNLIALILALVIERLTTRWLHLREPHWFDRYFEWSLRRFATLRGAQVVLIALLFTLLPVLPVAAVAAVATLFREWLSGFAYVGFAALVLIFSFGPRDLKGETDDYLLAVARGDEAQAARALMEHDAKQRLRAVPNTIEGAIFVEANNRIFGVAFWFLVAEPAGAWCFRVTDLMRRHTVMEHRDLFEHESRGIDFVHAVQAIHGVLAWVPARFRAIGFALAGSFDHALIWLVGVSLLVLFGRIV
jgi:AmpE protein